MYKITIEKYDLEQDQSGRLRENNNVTIYEQVVESLNVNSIIESVNQVEE